MSLSTLSTFYYGFEVTEENNMLDFKEGAGSELTAEIAVGSYTATDYATAIKTALDAAGALTYTVTFSRTTRKITITTATAHTLLASTGTHIGSGAWSMMGFAATDSTSANTHTGASAAGDQYTPQFILQDYIASEDQQQAVDATVNKTASGRVEVVSFGTEAFMECNIMFATDIVQPSNGPITSNTSGVSDLRRFMQFLVTKAPVEFMPSAASPSTFESMILESTPESQTGVGYRLKEMYDKNLPYYFQTGKLKFRVIS